MYGFIYLTRNKINDKKYIGMCKYSHENGYLGSGKLLKSAIKKYGKENFERIIIQECETFEELSKCEEYWIKKYDAVKNPNFYNLTSGGFGGNSDYLKEYWNKFTDEEKKKCRNWKKRNMTGQNNPMYGKTHSDETKKVIGSKSVNRNWNKPNHKGEKNPRSKKILVEIGNDKKIYDCLKNFYDEQKNVPYSTLKSIAQKRNFSKKYQLKITYV